MRTPSACSARHCARQHRRIPVLATTMVRALSATPARRAHEASSASSESSQASRRPQPSPAAATDFASLLAKPTWSVRALLPPSTHSPPSTSSSATPSSAPSSTTTTSSSTTSATAHQAPPPEGEEPITPSRLAHLLRLSALPLPRTPEDEAAMIRTLQSQLHFVRDVQSVDTAGVEPLRAIRDESPEGRAEATIGLDTLRDALAQEDVVGHSRRPRRRRAADGGEKAVQAEDASEVEGWDPLQTASRTAGRFFVVRSGKQ